MLSTSSVYIYMCLQWWPFATYAVKKHILWSLLRYCWLDLSQRLVLTFTSQNKPPHLGFASRACDGCTQSRMKTLGAMFVLDWWHSRGECDSLRATCNYAVSLWNSQIWWHTANPGVFFCLVHVAVDAALMKDILGFIGVTFVISLKSN